MDTELIKNLFLQGIDCSQVTAGAFAEELGMKESDLWKMASCFGGGMMCGETCGCVTGALMVLGLKHGHFVEGDMEQKNIMMAKVAEFKSLFLEKYGSSMCRDLIGHDISKPGELDKVLEEGTMFSFCPHVAADTIEMLKKVL